jgi:hypothetical protein
MLKLDLFQCYCLSSSTISSLVHSTVSALAKNSVTFKASVTFFFFTLHLRVSLGLVSIRLNFLVVSFAFDILLLVHQVISTSLIELEKRLIFFQSVSSIYLHRYSLVFSVTILVVSLGLLVGHVNVHVLLLHCY